MNGEYDLLVVGGGPGGSTAATLVAMQGYRVLLVEREALPVYKIGESLLPSTVNGICAMLGVTEELKKANFVVKQGGTFKWGKEKEPWTFKFSLASAMRGPTSYAYQVERSRFDKILLDNASRQGVDVREKHEAVGVLEDDDGRVCGLVLRDAAGVRREVRSRFVIDASGWASTLNRHVGTRVYSKHFQNLAVFSYFTGAQRLPAPNSGNIFCVAFERGWFWFIPLSETLTSVGAVIGQEHRPLLEDGTEQALTTLIGECEPIAALLAPARRATQPPYDVVRVRKDFSYCHTKFWRPGMALVGDAACFIDPVFSSGVHLSTYAALVAARSVNTCLKGVLDERRSFGEYESRYRREFRLFYDFLISFYDMEQSRDSYYWAARKILNSSEPANEAFVSLVAGIGGSGEGVYASSDEYWRSRASLSRQLFPAVSSGLAQTASPTNGSNDVETSGRFMRDLFTELGDMQAHALLGSRMPPARPLFAGGLVTASDGAHWTEPSTI